MIVKKSPVVTVVIPAYNAECSIRMPIESILNQTYGDLEVVVVDDGSTDGTKVLAMDYAKADKRVKVIEGKRSGVSVARNLGLNASEGSYVLFLDSDDYVERELVEVLYENAENNKADISFCGYRRVDEGGKVLQEIFCDVTGELIFNGLEFLKIAFDKTQVIWTGSAMYRRQLILENGISFVPGAVNGQDMEFIWKAIFNAHKVVGTRMFLSNYVQRASSLVRNKNLSKFHSLSSRLRFWKYLERNTADVELIDHFENRILLPSYVGILSFLSVNDDLGYKLIQIAKNKYFRQQLLRNTRKHSGTKNFILSRGLAYLPSVTIFTVNLLKKLLSPKL